MSLCETCGTPLPSQRVGRPRRFCDTCRKKRHNTQTAMLMRYRYLSNPSVVKTRKQQAVERNRAHYRAYNTEYQRKRRARLKSESQ